MKLIKDYFSLTKSETRGLLIVLIVVLGLLLLRLTLRTRSDGYDISFHPSNDSLENSEAKNSSIQSYTTDTSLIITGSKYSIASETFDPNTATYYELINRGMAPYIAQRIIKYRTSGGRFNVPEDLLKIYGIDSGLVFALSADIQIDSTIFNTNLEVKSKNLPYQISIDLNRTDSIQLKRISGIGTVLSARIVKYRDLLGGFYCTTQLREVYGIDDSLCFRIASVFTIDTTCIQKIDLNNASVYDLKKHPYLTYHEAKAITSYRRLIGPFDSKKQLIESYVLSESSYLKVAPYLALK